MDAGPEARDAGNDARATRDAGHDSGTVAGLDGGPDDPGWASWVSLADDCTIERAANPAALPRVDWEPCWDGLGPEGCLIPARSVFAFQGWFDSGEGYYALSETDRSNRRTVTLMRVSGQAVAAWRRPLRGEGVCALDIGLGAGFVAIVPGYFDGEAPERNVEHVFHGPIDAVNDLSTPVAIVSPGVQPQTVAVSEEVIAFWTGGQAFAIDPADGRVVRLGEPLAGIPQNVQVVGPHVLWEDWADLVRIAHADVATAPAIFHRADPGDVKQFHTDGIDFTWLEGFDRQPDGVYARLELWTAPYTRDAAALAPRMVRPMELHNGAAYGGGWYVMRRGDPRGYEIIDVRDGTRRWWLASVSQAPLYVSEHEILADGLVRFDPHELPVAD